jgi:hypothetical protein
MIPSHRPAVHAEVTVCGRFRAWIAAVNVGFANKLLSDIMSVPVQIEASEP